MTPDDDRVDGSVDTRTPSPTGSPGHEGSSAHPGSVAPTHAQSDRVTESPSPHGATGLSNMVELNALLGQGTRYAGKLSFDGRIRIEGEFEGEIRGEVLVIGTGAELVGDIEVDVCIVTGGQVRADIRARDAIELHAPAVVTGDLHAPNVFIDRGVQFEGSCKMAPLGATTPPPRAVQADEPPGDARTSGAVSEAAASAPQADAAASANQAAVPAAAPDAAPAAGAPAETSQGAHPPDPDGPRLGDTQRLDASDIPNE